MTVMNSSGNIAFTNNTYAKVSANLMHREYKGKENTMEELTGISKVCKKFHITSRTLRFYEKEGLIKSYREKETLPRSYAPEELEKLRKILVLRSLNLSIKDIKELFNSGQDISVAIRSKMVKLITELHEREKQLRNLGRAVTLLTENKDIFAEEEEEAVRTRQTEIAYNATDKLLQEDFTGFMEYFSKDARRYLTSGFIQAFTEDIKRLDGRLYQITECLPVGEEIYVYLSGAERTLLVKYLFHDEFIVAFTFDTLFFDSLR
ncbi:helix-turn-helix domain-containing protein [Anaerocolumna xylanovorans]|uniref:DNA-binding transcriptional regulator, MerR family n=1 Tax=Anaerocolumna xylanovorans DSM 12503 TaxID=1121345 RepID=A0A1M7XYX5_9FIRM|nr:MerR family transcriptional regulator [Anaerocolumna xylanovorans]SHO44327.1 DNA-binding transcriptional regulator, MerR family [Anaerocolumna xylanovorans DSM 12503]